MFYVVMGVCGSGKTTIGRLLAGKLQITYLEGDEFHPEENVAKMRSGIPLCDEDRWPWLKKIAQAMRDLQERNLNGVLSCSALKRSYRKMFADQELDVIFIYLHGDYETLHKRLTSRTDHFMKPGMLEAQLAILEVPDPTLESCVKVNISEDSEVIIQKILAQI